MAVLLGVNIDHVATLRQARRTFEPEPLQAALACEQAGADGITVHLREDRRHIQDADVRLLRERIHTRLNLELALRDEILAIACDLKPDSACIVPENRQEVTTEGGLAVAGREKEVGAAVERLRKAGLFVSLFINPDPREIEASAKVGATHIEIHTGHYANLRKPAEIETDLRLLAQSAELGRKLGLVVNAGHGLNYHNVQPLVAMGLFQEFNIGHAIISRAVFTGLDTAVRDMRALLFA